MVKIMRRFTIEDYFDLVLTVLKSNPTYSDDNTKWHPEDIHYALCTASENITNTLEELNKQNLLKKEKE